MSGETASRDEIVEGRYALMRVMHQQFWVQIIEVGDDAIRVSFPGADYPVAGMSVEIEFHYEDGYSVYTTEMTHRSKDSSEGIVLRAPDLLRRCMHRTNARIDANVRTSVRDQVHIAKHAGLVLNISRGGALILCKGEFELGATIEMSIELDDDRPQTVLAKVLHITYDEAEQSPCYGIRFISLEKDASEAIERFVELRLSEQYPII